MKLVLLAALAACSSNDTKAHRTGSAAPVELVPEPVYADGGASAAGATEEAEPNDAADVATPLTLGAAMRGKLDPADTDVDRYRLDIAQAGALAVFVTPTSPTAQLVLDIEDASGNVIAHSDRPAGREGVPNLGVTPGRYTAVVHGQPKKPGKKKGPEPPPPVYEITAQLSQLTAGAEREPDDDRGTANDLLIGDHATGFIGWDKDADVWKLSLEGLAGKTPIDIDVAKVDGVALELEVADGIGNVIATRKAPRGAPAAIHGLVPTVPQGGAPFHYLTVRGDRSNPDSSYEIAVSAGPINADAEAEPDDTPEHPYEIPPERTLVHGTYTPGDVDCYLVATGPVQHNVEVTVDDPGLAIEIVADGKPVTKPERSRAVAKVAANARTIIRVKPTTATSGKYELQIKDLGLPDLDH